MSSAGNMQKMQDPRMTPGERFALERRETVSRIIKEFLDGQNDLIATALSDAYALGLDHGIGLGPRRGDS